MPSRQDPPQAIDLAIGARLRLRRRQVGLRQAALAQALGVSFQQTQKYERGANRMAASSLVAAAAALGASVSSLVGEDPAGCDQEADVLHALSRPGALEIVQAFNAVRDPKARLALVALAREMAANP